MPANTDETIYVLQTETRFIWKHNVRYSCARFVNEHTIEEASVCDIVTKTVVLEMTMHAAANVVQLFVQTLVALQIILFLIEGSCYGCTIH